MPKVFQVYVFHGGSYGIRRHAKDAETVVHKDSAAGLEDGLECALNYIANMKERIISVVYMGLNGNFAHKYFVITEPMTTKATCSDCSDRTRADDDGMPPRT